MYALFCCLIEKAFDTIMNGEFKSKGGPNSLSPLEYAETYILSSILDDL